jgi:hypothetical protein
MPSPLCRALLFGLVVLLIPFTALRAELRGDHDAFFDGLLLLNAADQVLQHAPAGPANEQGRLHIAKAIDAFRSSCAAIDDRQLSPRGQRHRAAGELTAPPRQTALDLLHQARRRILSVPFDPFTAGPQYRSVLQIDEATRALMGA